MRAWERERDRERENVYVSVCVRERERGGEGGGGERERESEREGGREWGEPDRVTERDRETERERLYRDTLFARCCFFFFSSFLLFLPSEMYTCTVTTLWYDIRQNGESVRTVLSSPPLFFFLFVLH